MLRETLGAELAVEVAARFLQEQAGGRYRFRKQYARWDAGGCGGGELRCASKQTGRWLCTRWPCLSQLPACPAAPNCAARRRCRRRRWDGFSATCGARRSRRLCGGGCCRCGKTSCCCGTLKTLLPSTRWVALAAAAVVYAAPRPFHPPPPPDQAVLPLLLHPKLPLHLISLRPPAAHRPQHHLLLQHAGAALARRAAAPPQRLLPPPAGEPSSCITAYPLIQVFIHPRYSSTQCVPPHQFSRHRRSTAATLSVHIFTAPRFSLPRRRLPSSAVPPSPCTGCAVAAAGAPHAAGAHGGDRHACVRRGSGHDPRLRAPGDARAWVDRWVGAACVSL